MRAAYPRVYNQVAYKEHKDKYFWLARIEKASFARTINRINHSSNTTLGILLREWFHLNDGGNLMTPKKPCCK